MIYGSASNIPVFWQVVQADLGLSDLTVKSRYVDRIYDIDKKPLKFVGGDRTTGYFMYHPRKGYEIQILAALPLVEELETILHELRHVYQHRTKRLRGQWTWDGTRIPKTTPYRHLPWEIDARQYTALKLFDCALAAGFRVKLRRA